MSAVLESLSPQMIIKVYKTEIRLVTQGRQPIQEKVTLGFRERNYAREIKQRSHSVSITRASFIYPFQFSVISRSFS